MSRSFICPIRIYLEDTDALGLVYHANYLKFAERARTEAWRELGFSWKTFREERGLRIVVRSCHLNCLAPAYLDDVLEIRTYFKAFQYAKLSVSQAIMRQDTLIASVDVVLACINDLGKPIRISEDLRYLLTQLET